MSSKESALLDLKEIFFPDAHGAGCKTVFFQANGGGKGTYYTKVYVATGKDELLNISEAIHSAFDIRLGKHGLITQTGSLRPYQYIGEYIQRQFSETIELREIS